MPCYLFTYHAYGTWLPDRNRGYVKRGQGVLPRDMGMHRLYVKSMAEASVGLESEHQQTLVESLLQSAAPQRYELHAVATDASHVHALLAWRDDREAVHCRGIVKSSLSRALNGRFGKRT